jgi:hypothetical protein
LEENMSTRQQDATAASSAATGAREHRRSEIAEIGIRLLDDAHVAWQRAELECEQRLQAWFEGTARTRAEGYQSYLAALDREEAAAQDLQRLWEIASSSHAALAGAASQSAG